MCWKSELVRNSQSRVFGVKRPYLNLYQFIIITKRPYHNEIYDRPLYILTNIEPLLLSPMNFMETGSMSGPGFGLLVTYCGIKGQNIYVRIIFSE